MNWNFLAMIWRPDTYFLGGRKERLHRVTAPNRLVRLQASGRVYDSQRLTVDSQCKMDLRKFPMDTQECEVAIGSFGYSETEITYRWRSPEEKVVVEELALADYVLLDRSVGQKIVSNR
jgi:hypothetical protein